MTSSTGRVSFRVFSRGTLTRRLEEELHVLSGDLLITHRLCDEGAIKEK